MNTILSGHGTVGGDSQRVQSAENSRYCYMFDGLANTESKRTPAACAEYFKKLERFATLIDLQNSSGGDSSNLPAIYTYFGQFVNHDLSAPTATPRYSTEISKLALGTGRDSGVVSAGVDVIALLSAARPPNPDWLTQNIINQHPQPLCLHSLYGTGPDSDNSDIHDLYDRSTMKFHIGQTFDDPTAERPQDELNKMLHHDLVRKGGVVKIADQRNDGNVIIGQLHLAFMLFHNRAIEVLGPEYPNKKELFNKARELVTLHYQHCILNDYLKHLVPNETWGSRVKLEDAGAVPFEFTTAAFRFGHSMISSTYDYNRFFSGDTAASLGDLFEFTSRAKMGGVSQQGSGVRGEVQLPTHWVIDWARFFQPTQTPGSRAEQIDLILPPRMASLADLATSEKMEAGLASIAHRNLKRGYHRFMPCGQDVAFKLDVERLSPEQIRSAFPHHSANSVLTETGFDTKTPLWAYFLCEAKLLAGGNTLGPAAGSIIRGTIRSLIENCRGTANGPGPLNWTPHSSPLRLADGSPKGSPIVDIKSFLQFANVYKADAPV